MKPELRFDHLSVPNETLRPLTPADIDIPTMRIQLAESGLNLNIGEAERTSLSQKMFRKRSEGRGPGMVAVLGKEKTVALFDWCRQKAEGGPVIGGHEDTEGRGLRQLSADIIQLVTTPEPTQADLDRFCLRTNQRVMKGMLWDSKGKKEEKVLIRQVFAGIPKPDKTFSSVPTGSVADLWGFLISR